MYIKMKFGMLSEIKEDLAYNQMDNYAKSKFAFRGGARGP
jgi:hypothetical protein